MEESTTDFAYRVLQQDASNLMSNVEDEAQQVFTIIGVTYEDGHIADHSDTDGSLGIYGKDVESLRTAHAQMLQAFEAPILHTCDLPNHSDYVAVEDRERYENPEDGETDNSPDVTDGPVDTDTADSLPGQPHADPTVDPSIGAQVEAGIGEVGDGAAPEVEPTPDPEPVDEVKNPPIEAEGSEDNPEDDPEADVVSDKVEPE